jgi:hypothetical protein
MPSFSPFIIQFQEDRSSLHTLFEIRILIFQLLTAVFPQILSFFPSSSGSRAIHNLASKAAEAVHCGEDQGKFWEMHEQLMAKQDMLDKPSFYAANLSLSLPKFEECLNSGKHAGEIKADFEMAAKLGMTRFQDLYWRQRIRKIHQKQRASLHFAGLCR